MPSHMHRRDGGVYYTRMVVPPRLRPIIGKSDLGKSLRTKDRAEALDLYPYWFADARAVIAAAKAELAAGSAPVARAVPYDPYAGMTLEQVEGLEQFQREQLWEVIAEDDAEERLAQPEAKLSPDDAAVARLLKQARRERDRYKARYRKRKEADQQRSSGNSPNGITYVRTGVTITGLFEDYAAQPGISQSTASQFRAIIKHLVAFLGHDDASRVDHAALVRWRDHLRFEPSKDGKPRSAKTINGSYLAAASVTFAYGKDRLLIAANPAADVAKVRAAKPAKLREKDFTKAERKAILKAALEPVTGKLSATRALARRWVPWLCAYSGARVNELTQLRGADVQRIEGVWTIRI